MEGKEKIMTQNLGKLDRIFRFILGILWLSPMAPQFGAPWLNTVVFIVALIALVESFIGWCGLHSVFKINNCNQ
ncbi:hypothetical protein A3A09_01975 [Candidatus Nomurabacteria bacterium RIFCSPLOWO2_01_FULL_42_20]|uniref:Inner membrane protein YgaP-like transmembrane domain-containing protein n=1 Tax=Candidatus Nomurabacteria bacterium RIFCSPHIGHO2_01_FULL_42_16 TaxID=1801743 RepID=A0A1F6VH69_9BACT|nr:MAG: hypothetical protein A2824_02910 [Candidatus Nomurabacteria bacterium RIFCSPHIGHO2_01_FULL_42_16]OGI91388.1 MAG: hypothetical protein A3A09_01975 [Candidatus Nomurabacteria bacterium RIFCSPLOWO2_01_FULL_42_20]